MRRLLVRALTAARREAEDPWKVPPSAARVWFVAPLLLVPAAALLWWVDRPLLHSLAEEDGGLEWAQVGLFVLGAAAALGATRRLARGGRRAGAAVYLVLAAGLVFIAGEELAWGQRLLHFATPEGLAAVNTKAEVSVHNIASIEKWFTFGKLAASAYGTLGGWLAMGVGRRRGGSPWRPLVVPVFLSSPFLLVLAMRGLRLTVMREALPTGYSELEELILAWGTATFLCHAWRILPCSERESPAGEPEPRTSRRPPGTADGGLDGGPSSLPGDLPRRATGL